jgi:Flp pilus assembly secretin CpaC
MRLPISISRLLSAAAPIGILGCVTFGLLPSAQAEDETLVVTVDQARVVKVPAGTQTLIIGNPIIADVTMLKQGGTMIVTGKGYGQTNLIALDATGNPVAQSIIKVVGGNDDLVVQRGLDRQSYNCAPRCQPTTNLGDDSKYYGEVAGQIQSRNAQASGQK